jgi:hypothetical protein
VDTVNYTAVGKPYLNSHWLYQLLLYGIYQWRGFNGLILANLLLLLGLFMLMARRCQAAQTPGWILTLLLVAAILTMERRFITRPEVFSWVLLGGTFWVLESYGRRPHRWLWLLPFIQLLWVNLEGLFLIGWLVMGCYALAIMIERKKPDPQLSLFVLLSVAADFLNPYFAQGVAYPLSLISKLQGDMYNQTVLEMLTLPRFLAHPAFIHDSKLFIYLFFLYVLVFFAAALLTARSRKPHEILLAAGFFYLSFRGVRNIPLAMIATLPCAGASLGDAFGIIRTRVEKASLFPFLKRSVPWALALGLALGGFRVMTNAYYLSDLRPERFGLGLDDIKLPVEAARYLVRNKLEGRLLNSPSFGGWVEWFCAQPVYMDGNWDVVGDEQYERYLDMTYRNTLNGFSGELSRINADIVLFEPLAESSWIDQLRRLPNWRLVYADNCSVIYLKKGYRDDIPPLDWNGMLSSLGLHPPGETDLVEGYAGLGRSELSYWLDGFSQPRLNTWACLNRGFLAMKYGQQGALLALDQELVRQTGGFYAPFIENLIEDCLNMRNPAGALLGYERLLFLNPGDKKAWKGFYALSNS